MSIDVLTRTDGGDHLTRVCDRCGYRIADLGDQGMRAEGWHIATTAQGDDKCPRCVAEDESATGSIAAALRDCCDTAAAAVERVGS